MCYIVTCMFLFWFEIWLSHSISLWSLFFTPVEKVSCVCTWTIPYADCDKCCRFDCFLPVDGRWCVNLERWASERVRGWGRRDSISEWAWFRCGRTSTSLTWRSSCVSYKYKWHNTARVSPHKGKSRENSHVTRNAFWYRNGKMRFWQNAEYWL